MQNSHKNTFNHQTPFFYRIFEAQWSLPIEQIKKSLLNTESFPYYSKNPIACAIKKLTNI